MKASLMASLSSALERHGKISNPLNILFLLNLNIYYYLLMIQIWVFTILPFYFCPFLHFPDTLDIRRIFIWEGKGLFGFVEIEQICIYCTME